MRRSFIVLFSFILLLSSNYCKKEPICACSVEQPELNLKWLKDFLASNTYANVYKLNVEGVEYIICTLIPDPSAISLVFDCSGNLLCRSGEQYSGDNTCYFISPSWDNYYKNRTLIFEKRE